MKKTSSLIIVATLFILSACATNYEEEKTVLLTNTETPDLVSSFEVDKEKAEGLVAKPVDLSAPPTTQVKALDKNPTKKAGKEVTGKTKDKKNPAAPVVAAAPAAEVAEYSEEFKGYDIKSKLVWDKFKPVFYEGEQSIMSISYLGVTAGHITITSQNVVTLKNKLAYHYFARFKSNDSYRYFYWLDDKLDTYVEKETFLPMKYSLTQREKKQNVDDLQLFDFDKLMTYHWYKRVKEGSNKEEKIEKPIPRYAQDSFAALQLVRGLPLIKGDVYEFPIVTRGKIWLLKVEVLGEDLINVGNKEVKAIKIKAETNFPGVLKKSGDIIFWYGNDQEKRLLKFQAKIKIGSVFGELVEYKPGKLLK
jgi:hypothetical protein